MKMPAQMKEDWVKALESGEYQQGYGRLQDSCGGYCCLGVLQQMVSGKLETIYEDGTGKIKDAPSLQWYMDNGIEVAVNPVYSNYLNDDQVNKLMSMNDGEETNEYDDDGEIVWSGDKTFPQIAEWIRENIETI